MDLNAVFSERLKSRETVFFGHSVKKTASKVITSLQLAVSAASSAGDPKAVAAACTGAIVDLGLYGCEVDKAELVSETCLGQLQDYQTLETQVDIDLYSFWRNDLTSCQ